MLFFHGALNTKKGALEGAVAKLADFGSGEKLYPIFVNWDGSFWSAYREHLTKIRQGRENLFMGYVTAPIVLGTDIFVGAATAPMTWIYQTKNEFTGEFRSTDRYRRMADDRHRLEWNRKRNGKPNSFTISPHLSSWDDRDAPQFSFWRTPRRLLIKVMQIPFQLMVSPLLASGGTETWSNYVRRIYATIRLPDEFDQRLDVGPTTNTRRARQQGALALLVKTLEKEFPCRIKFTLIGHSTGAISVNRLVEEFPEVDFERIVYLASAASVADFRATIVPYMRDHNTTSRFFNVSLNPYSEQRETTLFVTPSGSLLEWLDIFFTKPAHETSRVMGKWDNTMNSMSVILDDISDRVTLTKLEYEGDRSFFSRPTFPQRHGDLDGHWDTYRFWCEDSWRGDKLEGKRGPGDEDEPESCFPEWARNAPGRHSEANVKMGTSDSAPGRFHLNAVCEPSAEFGQIGLALNRSTQQPHRIRLLDIESQASCADAD